MIYSFYFRGVNAFTTPLRLRHGFVISNVLNLYVLLYANTSIHFCIFFRGFSISLGDRPFKQAIIFERKYYVISKPHLNNNRVWWRHMKFKPISSNWHSNLQNQHKEITISKERWKQWQENHSYTVSVKVTKMLTAAVWLTWYSTIRLNKLQKVPIYRPTLNIRENFKTIF